MANNEKNCVKKCLYNPVARVHVVIYVCYECNEYNRVVANQHHQPNHSAVSGQRLCVWVGLFVFTGGVSVRVVFAENQEENDQEKHIDRMGFVLGYD